MSYPIPLETGETAMVDDEFAWLVFQRWSLSDRGYARSSSGIFMHRFILGLCKGDKLQGDHEDGDKLNNRRGNLRIVTYAQNRQNERPRKTYAGRTPASRYRGVFFRSESFRRKRPNGKHWFVKHRLGGQEHHGGSFYTEEEAAIAAQDWRAKHMPYSTN